MYESLLASKSGLTRLTQMDGIEKKRPIRIEFSPPAEERKDPEKNQ